MNCPTRDPEPTGNPTFNQSPPAYEKTLVPRSSPVCGGGTISSDEYNTGLHIMALFVVLAQSTIACAFPLIAKRFPCLRIPPSFLFFARHFGTGVLISTAFVHLLPTAFISLTDPCLPPFWNDHYPAMAGAIAMCAVFLVTLVEMVFTRGVCKGQYDAHSHAQAHIESGVVVKPAGKEKETGRADAEAREAEEEEEEEDEEEEDAGMFSDAAELPRGGTPDSEHIGGRGGVGKLGFGMVGQRRSRSHSLSHGLHRVNEISLSRADSTTAAPTVRGGPQNPVSLTLPPLKPHSIQLTPKQAHQKAMLQVFLLEMGILFHSVFIGMALSVTVGPPFIVLLIAIIFHQTFEGLALGSRIASINWKAGSPHPWCMAMAYGLTTPIGQAIGIGTHNLYAPDSQTGLLMVGIMNAISSGLLVFAGLVELLAEDFLSDESWTTLRGRRRIMAFFWVAAGAVCMSVVGAFA